MVKKNKILVGLASVIAMALFAVGINTNSVMADGFGLTVTPMNQKIVINPGDTYEGSFKISNPAASTEPTHYEISAEPFYLNGKNDVVYEEEGEMGKIVDWVKFNVPTEGRLEPNEVKEVMFTITVPKNAPAGGQYLAITTKSENANSKKDASENSGGNKAMIEEIKRVAHLIYAEITGATVKKGEITDANVPGFLFSGKIKGSSSVTNQGNVHGTATYKLQVFPLFSNEEVYTNEEDPTTLTILPNRTVYDELTWDETPSFGIFNVVYSVEFQGSTAEVKKMVIVCPMWLLFVIIFVVVALIIFIVIKVKKRGSRKEAEA